MALVGRVEEATSTGCGERLGGEVVGSLIDD
jgi:hypothetical protein